MRSHAWILLVAACHGAAVAPTVTAPVATITKLGDAKAIMTPGERMTYRVQMQGMELAAMTLAVGDATDVGGKRAIVVQGHAKSVGLANMIAAIDDTFTSWIDPTTGRSLRFAVDEYETNSKTNIEHTVADLAAHTPTQLPITFAVNAAPPVPEPQTLAQSDPWDYNAFLVALRGWTAPVGASASIEVLRSRWLWHVDVVVGAREKLHTELGDLPAVRFDAKTFKLDRAGKRDQTQVERTFSIWISDDSDRVPLQISARTDYGEMQMQIVEYTPGA